MSRINLAPRDFATYSRPAPRQQRTSQGTTSATRAAKPTALVPPARYDCMHAPLYQPSPEAPRRPGADDHYRHASRGF